MDSKMRMFSLHKDKLFVAGSIIILLYIRCSSDLEESEPYSTIETLPDIQEIKNIVNEEDHHDIQPVPLYIITPTYPRWTQLPDMVRLGNTLKNVENVVWLIAEDTEHRNQPILDFVNSLGLRFEYFLAPMSLKDRKLKAKPRGVTNRNEALKWIYKNADSDGVFYFADDDNSYRLELFEEIRKTKKVSVLPVGLVGSSYSTSPVLNSDGVVSDFVALWRGKRTFVVDMAEFAVNVGFYKEQSGKSPILMPAKTYYEEELFLRKLKISPAELEPLADGCTKVYVWHTQTKKHKTTPRSGVTTKIKGVNLAALAKLHKELKVSIDDRYKT